jgi:hypothetical protein
MSRSPFVPTNVRPSNYNTTDFNIGDCTTRSMCYVLQGELSYEEIEAEQYKIGGLMKKPRNMTGVWDKVLLNRGFVWIQFNETYITRQTLATILKDFINPMVTISSGHACAIHQGKVIDVWDSRGGKVYGLLVREIDNNCIIEKMSQYGISCENVNIPTKTRRHYKRRTPKWYW